MIVNLFLYFLSFIFIWFGSGLIVSSVGKFAHLLRVSSFSLSFFVLGFLTSIPELAVGIDSIFKKTPEIFVGNLIGGQIVLFILIIPLLAIFGKGISLKHELSEKNLLFSLFVILAPALLVSDRRVTLFEGVLLILLYLLLFYSVEKKQGLVEKVFHQFTNHQKTFLSDMVKIAIGVVIVVASSFLIVDKTIYFSKIFHLSSFFIALIVIAIGTNLPELSLVLRSIREKKKEVAFGDYLGSAAANSAIFGTLTIINSADVIIPNNFLSYFVFIVLGLGLFYFFTRSKNDISRKEGFLLLFVYIVFLLFEIKNNLG